MKKYLILIAAVSVTALTSCDKECHEKEKVNCISTLEYSPVCGCNGKTYDNPSTAECNGIDDYTSGACKSN